MLTLAIMTPLNSAVATNVRGIPAAPFALPVRSGPARNVMVCFSLEPSRFQDLVRRGLEAAERLDGRLYLAHVETLRESIRGAAKERLRELLEGVVAAHGGSEIVWLKGREAAETLLDFARDSGVGVVVVGRSSVHSHLAWLRRSAYRALIQKARHVAIEVVGFRGSELNGRAVPGN